VLAYVPQVLVTPSATNSFNRTTYLKSGYVVVAYTDVVSFISELYRLYMCVCVCVCVCVVHVHSAHMLN
jgi:hypothetical protein